MSIEILCAVILPGAVAIAMGRGFPERKGMSSFGVGMLGALSLLVMLPEVAKGFPWEVAVGALGLGLGLAWAMDRYVQPVCPECSGEGSWWSMVPLFGALAVHGLLDGAMIGLSKPRTFSNWVLMLHRVPEALATYALIESTGVARIWARWQMAGLQLATLAGLLLARQVDMELMTLGQGVVGGVLLHLGAHRLHHAWVEREMDLRGVGIGVACVCLVQWIG
jgi:hypothetical protein